MLNRDIEAAWRYHNGTKLSWHIVNNVSHLLDWSNKPIPFKIYPHLEGQELPGDLLSSGVPALAGTPVRVEPGVPTRLDLARLLYFAAGITRRGVFPQGQIYFRAAACTGALYHIEIYLVCGDLPDLPAGVYHFGPHDFALRRLREGDYRGVLVEASGDGPAISGAPVVMVTTSVYWRNSWKSQARAYRHAYWDSGTILANLLAVGAAIRLPLKVVTAFVDRPVNRLLGLDDQQEAALQLVPVGLDHRGAIPPPPEVAPLDLEVTAYSSREVAYPATSEMHTASSLHSVREVRELWGNPPPLGDPQPQGNLFPLEPTPEAELPTDSIEAVILRRGSSRRFRRAPITYRQLSTVVDQATRDMPADFLHGPGGRPRAEAVTGLTQLYLIVQDVEGLPPGSYVYDQKRGSLEQLKVGNFREQAGYLGLQQALAADASVDAFFLTDLAAVLERYGNRGYRMAQLEAGIRGGWAYLGSYAQGLGASGLTFFDDDVTEFFSPHARGKSVMFFVGLGHPRGRQRQPG
ncbi:MAG TPA: SagB/ThcOx family dehydrogenase [Dehalococcoidia bacterium]|nr:SagB/ThcOx family dehydrogenase [Dehalococcoidia bacterium]